MHVNIFYDARASYVNDWAKQLQFILTFMITWKCKQLMFVFFVKVLNMLIRADAFVKLCWQQTSVGVQTMCMVSVHIFM